MLQRQGDTDVRHRRVRNFGHDPLSRRRRRKDLRGRHRWLPTHEQRGMGNLHLDRAIQVMRGVRLRQVPTVLSECGKDWNCEKKQDDCGALRYFSPSLRRTRVAARRTSKLSPRDGTCRFPQNMHNGSIVRCQAPGKQPSFRVSCLFGLSR